MAAKNADKVIGKKGSRYVKVEDIKFDPSYQRGETSGIKRIIDSFDKDAFGQPLVAQREDGSLWGVDGRQRLTAVKKMGWKEVRVDVFASKGPEHEAMIFKLVNANRTKLKPWDLFKAKLAGQDADAWALKELVESLGLSISDGSRNNSRVANSWKAISAINMLETLVRRMKDKAKAHDRLKRVLSVASEAWDGDKFALSSEIIGGLWSFYHNRGDEMVDDERLIVRLRTSQPQKVVYSAGMLIGDRYATIGQVIDKLYARRMRKPEQA